MKKDNLETKAKVKALHDELFPHEKAVREGGEEESVLS